MIAGVIVTHDTVTVTSHSHYTWYNISLTCDKFLFILKN